MTEQLPWASRGAQAEPTPASPHASTDWSVGTWSQPDRDAAPEPPASRRQLRERREGLVTPSHSPVPAPAPAPLGDSLADSLADPFADPRGEPSVRAPRRSVPPPPSAPATGELEIYDLRREPQRRSSRREAALPELGEHRSARGEVFRAGVERWSRWAAGLGRPPRDAQGVRHYPGREVLVPPAVWLTVAIGVAALVGLAGGIVVSGGSSNASVTTAVATTTATVTNATTAPAVTVTTTRTRTTTLTIAPTPTDPGQGPAAGPTLAPGSQGAAVAVLQQELAQLGLYQGAPTGTYDAQTQGAVQNFQARAGITQDQPGVAGPTTIQAINQAVGR